jgi:hypothetical protein
VGLRGPQRIKRRLFGFSAFGLFECLVARFAIGLDLILVGEHFAPIAFMQRPLPVPMGPEGTAINRGLPFTAFSDRQQVF